MKQFLKRMDLLTRFSLILFLMAAGVFAAYYVLLVARKDTSGPMITIASNRIEISVEDEDAVLLEGVSAVDDRDGDVTSTIMVESLSNIFNGNERIVTYAAVDQSHNVSTAKRTVVYTDYRSPEFHLSMPLRFPTGMTNLMTGMTVSDCLDGDITNSIKITSESTYRAAVAGTYEMTFQASNSAGDVAEFPARVELYNTYTSRPVDILLKEYAVYVDRGSVFNARDYLEAVALNGVVYQFDEGEGSYGDPYTEIKNQTIGKGRVLVSGEVNTSEPGGYEITYSLTMTTTSGDQVSGQTYLPVIVRDN